MQDESRGTASIEWGKTVIRKNVGNNLVCQEGGINRLYRK